MTPVYEFASSYDDGWQGEDVVTLNDYSRVETVFRGSVGAFTLVTTAMGAKVNATRLLRAAPRAGLADDVLREVDSVVLERLRLGAEVEIPAGTQGIRKMMSDLSVVSGNEVGLLRMADGRRLLVMGGPNAIRLPRHTARIIAHTHPRGRLSFSAADLRALNARGQTMSVIISSWDDIAVILRVGGN